MSPKPWKTLSTREIYKNNWLRLREDIAEMPNGQSTIYSVCELGEAVGVLSYIGENHVVMVRQYRYTQRENHRWEIPAGRIEYGELPEAAAQRELMEEIGYRANSLTWINTFYPSNYACELTAHLYIGRNLVQAEAIPDETEFLEVSVFPFDDVFEMVTRGEIRDSFTVIAVLYAAQLEQVRDSRR